ncbi:hypothetical protein ACWDXT_11210 [Streptomyces sp. NPDC003236]
MTATMIGDITAINAVMSRSHCHHPGSIAACAPVSHCALQCNALGGTLEFRFLIK